MSLTAELLNSIFTDVIYDILLAQTKIELHSNRL